jgi:putative nucleotidyltransferase with HDIG domain
VLGGRLLQLANSARFETGEPVSQLAQAAARVGIPVARRVLLSASVGRLFASRPLQILWQKSQIIAEMASLAASACGLDPQVAYAAGLLHDIGRLVFESADARLHINVQEWLRSGFPLTYAEALTYSMDHASAGAKLLRAWELPKVLVDAVENHHQPERSRSPLASLLFLLEEWYAEKFDGAETRDLFPGMRSVYAAGLTGLSPHLLAELEVEDRYAVAS